MKDLSGKIAVVTGAASGIGAAMARRFAAEGMRVIVADIDDTGAERVAAELHQTGVDAIAVKVDVSSTESLNGLTVVAKDFGGCHLLCANVGVQRIAHVNEHTAQDWQWIVNVNLLGTVATVNALLPLMHMQGGEKHIVFTSSMSGLFAAPRLAAYTASKYAVTGYAETLRLELADIGVGVTVMFPSAVRTQHMESSAKVRQKCLGEAPVIDMEAAMLAGSAFVRSPDDAVDADYAVRNIVEAVRSNQPYLFTHGGALHNVAARFEALRDAMESADH